MRRYIGESYKQVMLSRAGKRLYAEASTTREHLFVAPRLGQEKKTLGGMCVVMFLTDCTTKSTGLSREDVIHTKFLQRRHYWEHLLHQGVGHVFECERNSEQHG